MEVTLLPQPKHQLPHGARTSGLGTSVTMENAFAFGFKAGCGIAAAQILIGGVLWFVIYFAMNASLSR